MKCNRKPYSSFSYALAFILYAIENCLLNNACFNKTALVIKCHQLIGNISFIMKEKSCFIYLMPIFFFSLVILCGILPLWIKLPRVPFAYLLDND